MIEYIREKYGRDHVAQIVTFNSLGAKSAIRDVGRVLEVPLVDCDKLAKMIPEEPKITLERAMLMSPDLSDAYGSDPVAKKIIDYSFVLEGLSKNIGLHAAGVVIGNMPLIDIVPLARDKNQEIITQFSKDYVEALGLLKADCLGLKTLTVIQEALDLIEEKKGIKLLASDIPMDDKATFELVARGDTVGVFQLESRGMRDLARRIGLNRFEDLIAMIALFRPGPMRMLDDYVNRKSGQVDIVYQHKLLEPILEETYGVMIYQEQVQQAANVLAGYTLGEGDLLRRAMGKKMPDEMEKQRTKFIEGCQKKNKIAADKAEEIFDSISKFAEYGFNKSHSAGYAILACQTAYLKAHYPEEYMAALISGEIGNYEKLVVFIEEAKYMELAVLPPDINKSVVRFDPEEKAIRYGLAGIKNVGEGAAQAIVEERLANGPFKDLIDLCSRVDARAVNKKVLESLARCGALDSLGEHRAKIFNNIGYAMSRAISIQRDKAAGQGNLFDLLDDNSAFDENELSEYAVWHEKEMLVGEMELLGIYVSGHPLAQYESLLKTYRLSSIIQLRDKEDGQKVRTGGMISALSKRITKKKQETMAVLTLEDLESSVEVLVFPKTYKDFSDVLQMGAPVIVCGELNGEEGAQKIFATEVYPLEEAGNYFATKIHLHLTESLANKELLNKMRDICADNPGDSELIVCLELTKGVKIFIEADHGLRVNPSMTFLKEMDQLLGEGSVFVAVDQTPCLREDTLNQRKNWNNRRS